MRLAVTDRCNLRCHYCMPAEGLQWLQRSELLSYEEMLRLCGIIMALGVNKIRITGGEPFSRKDMMPFLERLAPLNGLKILTLTTNGVLTLPYLPRLKAVGITGINLSLDTLNPATFFQITRRDEFKAVMDTLYGCLEAGISVKVNAVVMDGINTADIIPLVALTADLPIEVRFIEEMPFNGGTVFNTMPAWNYHKILAHIATHYPAITKVEQPGYNTASVYQIEGHKGQVGIIAAYSRTFCGSCNRLRLTPEGILKTCLYEHGGLNLKQLMRSGATDLQLADSITHAVLHKAKDGHEAEAQHNGSKATFESMAAIGG